MTKRWRFHRDAEEELVAAAAWYEREAGRGADFVATFRRAYARLRAVLGSAAALRGVEGVRRARFDGYPYQIVFVELADAFLVLAIAHQKRAPNYWLHRLEP